MGGDDGDAGRAEISAGDVDDDEVFAVERFHELAAVARTTFGAPVSGRSAALPGASLPHHLDVQIVGKLALQTLVRFRLCPLHDDELHPDAGIVVDGRPGVSPARPAADVV